LGEKMKYLTEGLPKKQVLVLKKVGPQTSSSGFYLAGGTALAIYLGHRVSVDLDWFTPDVFEDGMLVAQSLRNSNIQVEIEQVSPGTLHGSKVFYIYLESSKLILQRRPTSILLFYLSQILLPFICFP